MPLARISHSFSGRPGTGLGGGDDPVRSSEAVEVIEETADLEWIPAIMHQITKRTHEGVSFLKVA